MGLRAKRREVQALKKREQHLANVIAHKVEERRAASEERRELIARRKAKKKRDPKSKERQELLERQIARLHDEIMELGDQVGRDTRRLEDLRPLRKKVRRQLKRAQLELHKLLRMGGPDAALKAARRDNGKHEEPAGSNWGPWVGKVIRWLGYSGPVYWCGCAAGWWTLKKGKGSYSSRIRRGYAGFIEQDARANTNGLRAVSSPAKGGVASLWNNEHVVVTTGRVSGGMFESAEGNTSAADGSQSNGGMAVYGKWRALSDADVFAVQDYPND
jgi:hypothetical protein